MGAIKPAYSPGSLAWIMEFIRGQHNIADRHHGCVASVGNYDGIHPGHRQVIQRLVEKSRMYGLPSVIVSFEPHPLEFFVGDKAPPRLMSVRDKITALRTLDVDRMCCLRFNHQLANTEAEDFIQDLLIKKLGVRCILVGDDFRFGRNRRGDFGMLRSIGEANGMQVEKTESFLVEGLRVSSSSIRACLSVGDLPAASRLLGRPYSISGRVVRGDGNAANWGFATANIRTRIQKPVLQGVFVAQVRLPDGRLRPAVSSFGIRPTIGGTAPVLEAHLLDYEGDLYGQYIQLQFLHKLRDEAAFASVEAMCGQIQLDIEAARQYFLQSRHHRAL